MPSRIPVAVLGATGAVGQRFVQLLADHAMFEIACLAASERSIGVKYADKTNWVLETPMPECVSGMEIEPVNINTLKEHDVRLVFSALPSQFATEIEVELAEEGFFVSSNASSHRMDPFVPILIPDINPDHLDVIRFQHERGWNGSLVTNSNCTTSGLVFGLKPLLKYGISSVHVTTMQAISGAGYPGVPSLDITENIVPFISGEEDKMAREPQKILGELGEGKIVPADFQISATCTRVPVINGHLETVFIGFESPPAVDEAARLLRDYSSEPQKMGLPSAPRPPIIVTDKPDRPQPRLDRMNGHPASAKGMAITIGKVQSFANGIKLVLLVHNTIRGAAGGSILAAEYAAKKGVI
ncbi:MAG: aspartate-semialdehyde dehydrogenase [Candidatus Ranarchaeia archaeon]